MLKKIAPVFLFLSLACEPISAANAFVAPAPTAKPAVFSDDLRALDQEFAGLTALENLAAAHSATRSALAAEQNPLLQNLSAEQPSAALFMGPSAPGDERVAGIPSFLWGFCLGLLGVIPGLLALVLINASIDDPAIKKSESRKALFGCATAGAVWIAFYAGLLLTTQPQ